MAPDGNVVLFFRYQDSFKRLQGEGGDPLKIIPFGGFGGELARGKYRK